MVFDSGSNCLQLLYSFILKFIWALYFCLLCMCMCFICFSERLLGNQPTWTNLGIGCCGKGFINHSSPPYGIPYPSRNTLPQPKASAVLWFCHVIHLLSSSSEKQLQHKPGAPARITWLRRLYLNKDQLLSFIKPHFCSIL